jgi:uncharacterized protein (TIGR00297 family)
MNRFVAQFPLGLIAAAGVSLAAYRLATLTRSGALAATLTGSMVFAGTGLRGSAGLFAYFASSSVLGKLPSAIHPDQRRGNTRDAVQVLANGGVPALLAAFSAIGPERLRPLVYAGFAGSLAAAAADTWATEIGSRATANPRSIVTLQRVPRGSSGGVTVIGLLASAAGALFVAGVSSADPTTHALWRTPLFAIALGGFAGSLADSLLGATVQELRVCNACLRRTEHTTCCGEPTRRVRGVAGVDNDVVNALAVTIGAAVTIVTVMPKMAPGSVSGAATCGFGVRPRLIWTPLRREV